MSRMASVESSAIEYVEYGNDATMDVKFRSGALYTYEGVPESVFEEFLAAPSKGRFFAASIKPQYPGIRCGYVR